MARRWGDPVTAIANTELLYPETALAIAILETGGFSSRTMMRTHNWFGFRSNGRGYQKRISKGYGVYASSAMMLRDYQAWEWDVCMKYGLTSEKLFRNWVVRHYATDPQYARKLNQNLGSIHQAWVKN